MVYRVRPLHAVSLWLRILLAALCAVVWFQSGTALADSQRPPSPGERIRKELEQRPWDALGRLQRFALRLDVVSAPTITALSVAPAVVLVLGSMPSSINGLLTLDMPFGFGLPDLRGGNGISFFGNPTIGGQVALSNHAKVPSFVGSMGLRVSLPVNNGDFSLANYYDDEGGMLDPKKALKIAHEKRSLARRTIWALANGDAGYDPHRYAGGYVPMGLPLSIEGLHPNVMVRAEVVPMVFIPVLERAGDPARTALQGSIEAAGRTGYSEARAMGGARLQVIYACCGRMDTFQDLNELVPWPVATDASPDNANDTHGQWAVEPFIGVHTRATFFRLGSLIPLDAPLGFAFDQQRLYSIRFSITGRL